MPRKKDPFAQALLSNCGVRGTWMGQMGGQSYIVGVSVNGQYGSGVWAFDQFGQVWVWDPTAQNVWFAGGVSTVTGAERAGSSNGARITDTVNNWQITCPTTGDCTNYNTVQNQIGGSAQHGIVSPNVNEAWGIDPSGFVNHSGNGAAFQRVGGSPSNVTQLAMSAFNGGGSACDTLWALTASGGLYKCSSTLNGSSYTYITQVAAPAGIHPAGIAVADANNVWMIPQSGTTGAYSYTGSGWASHSSGAAFVQIAAGPGSGMVVPAEVWALDASGIVYRYFGGSFVNSGGVALNNSSLKQRLAVGGHGDNTWVIGTDSNLYNW